MAVFGVSITKRTDWRGDTQPFSNVYHYVTQVGEPFDDDAVIDELVAAERLVHAADVTFVTARTWGPTSDTAGGGEIQPLNPQAESVTRVIRDLSGAGSVPKADIEFYKELAFLCVWPLGRYGRRNRPQFLRKWIHSMDDFGLTTQQRSGATVITTPPAALTAYINDVRNVGPVEGYGLCSDTGREPIGPGFVYPYLEHRQLGR